MNSSAEDVRPWHPLVPYAHPIRYPTRTGRAHERRGQEKSRADHHLGRREGSRRVVRHYLSE